MRCPPPSRSHVSSLDLSRLCGRKAPTVWRHPLVDKLGSHAVRRLTMYKLESYNVFTEKLEYEAVMAASIKIDQNPQVFGLSEEAGREARLIVPTKVTTPAWPLN